MEANVKWNTKLSFTGNVRGHETQLDTTLANGSLNRGPSPKEMLLNAISACAGMDIASILENKKEPLLTLDINAKANMTKTTPSYFADIHLIYKIGGEVSKDMAIKACEASMTKYCGVSLMLSKVCPITYDVLLNGEKIFSGESKF
ncbi:OsmC family peroxiredoxin [Bacteriovorax stolpii]|uniref:OsmC family protein n=1 Tax=Bacteriovorax stolpii TaxID=960 RepID=UPI001159CFF8|nr:OsmC family protein [Bacteriovorax stolpii]QDK43541.1 OsmC family peroxiredoxin [Bacteriovorax stolpii]